MTVEVQEFKKLGKEKSFLNKDGKTVSSLLAEIVCIDNEGQQHRVVGLCGTQVCRQLEELQHDVSLIGKASIRFDISPSRNNPNYKFTTCYVEEIIQS